MYFTINFDIYYFSLVYIKRVTFAVLIIVHALVCVQFVINKCEYDSHVPCPPEYDVSRGDTCVLLLSEFSFEGFSSETTRSMVAMMDVSLTTEADLVPDKNC